MRTMGFDIDIFLIIPSWYLIYSVYRKNLWICRD
jgi:hypothetical protein